jgi:Fe-S-cluster containining protein
MNTFKEKAEAVSQLFTKLDQEIADFQAATSLHCLHGCGECCKKSDIEATILEFIPFAVYVCENNEEDVWLAKVDEGRRVNPICRILSSHLPNGSSGLCSQYQYRGMICRLFGYAAFLDKNEAPHLATCKLIKNEQSTNYALAQERINDGLKVPIMKNYYHQLQVIDYELTKDFYPINEAIRLAIHKVAMQKYYQGL